MDSSICNKVDDGKDCKVDSECKSNFCFYSFNDVSSKLKGKCVKIDADNEPNGNNNDICLHRSILNNFYKINQCLYISEQKKLSPNGQIITAI